LSVQYDVDESVLKEMVPPFTLQPLVENAIQHGIVEMGEDCLIKITIRDQSNYMKIEVEDNGAGISDDKLASLGKQQVTSEHGTGMGLYNVNRRLTMMYGDQAALQITSHINEGTKIFFSIKEISGGCIIMTIKVLVIDDERYAREELIYLLEQFEDIYVSGEVENGEDALKKVLQEEPDVVFLDVEMPRMN